MENIPQDPESLSRTVSAFTFATSKETHASLETNQKLEGLVQLIKEYNDPSNKELFNSIKKLKDHSWKTIKASSNQNPLSRLASKLKNLLFGDRTFRTSGEIATKIMNDLDTSLSAQSSNTRPTRRAAQPKRKPPPTSSPPKTENTSSTQKTDSPPKKSTSQELKEQLREGLKKDANAPFPPILTADHTHGWADLLLNDIVDDLIAKISPGSPNNTEDLDLAARAAGRIHNKDVRSDKLNEVSIYGILSNITPLSKASASQRENNIEGFKELNRMYSQIKGKELAYIKGFQTSHKGKNIQGNIRDYIEKHCSVERDDYNTNKEFTAFRKDPKGFLANHLRTNSSGSLPPMLKNNPSLANALLVEIIDDRIAKLDPADGSLSTTSFNKASIQSMMKLVEKIEDKEIRSNKRNELEAYRVAQDLVPSWGKDPSKNTRIFRQIEEFLSKITDKKPDIVPEFRSAYPAKDATKTARNYVNTFRAASEPWKSQSSTKTEAPAPTPTQSLSPEESVKKMAGKLQNSKNKPKLLSKIITQLNQVETPDTKKELALSVVMNMGIHYEDNAGEYSIEQKTQLLMAVTGSDRDSFSEAKINSTSKKMALTFHPDKLTRSDSKLADLTNNKAKLEEEKKKLIAQNTEKPTPALEQKLKALRNEIKETTEAAKSITDKYASAFSAINGLAESLKADFASLKKKQTS